MLVWFSILVAMSTQLTVTGVTQYFTGQISTFMGQFTSNWVATFYFLHAFYFVMHYLIASQTAHVAALYTAFLSIMIAAGVPPVLGALTLAFNNNLFGGKTAGIIVRMRPARGRGGWGRGQTDPADGQRADRAWNWV